MTVLVATVCLLFDTLTVDCQTNAIRIEQTPRECIRLIKPVEAMLTEQAGKAKVVYIKAACKRGPLM